MGCSSSKGVMVTAESIAKQAIESNTVVIFSKSYCPFCMKAKNVLESLNAKYEVLELDLRDDGNAIQDVLNTLSGGRSVPRVFVKGKFIGGGDDMVSKKESGELQQILQEAGAL
uniref:Glutaredoxin domain-containing protein n=1 Tax=Hanusia phi TaxID=3032 RepID=A0A7S0HD74_9CRYP